MWAEIRGKKLVMIVIAGVMALFAGALLVVGVLGFTSGGSLLSPTVVIYCVIGIGVMVPVVLAVMWSLRRQILKEEEAKRVSEQQGE
jgi:uncharacterized membrane protein